MRAPRRKVDWSKHQLTVQKNDLVTIHSFRKPDTGCQSVKFINTQGILAVTGDWGNWIFCREFIPSPKEDYGVSDGYWMEKLRISSTQDPMKFDSEEAKKEIYQLCLRHRRELSDEEKEWLRELSAAADDGEYAYNGKAVEYPSTFEAEMIPHGKVVKTWLLVVFDAFDEICRRLKEEEDAVKNTNAEQATEGGEA